MPSQTTSPAALVSNETTHGALPGLIQDEIKALLQRLVGYQIGTFFWNKLLTEDERRQLGGDFDVALRKEHIVNIWARLHRQSLSRAVIELSYHTELVSHKKYGELLREIGVAQPLCTPINKPAWIRDRCELVFCDEVVCRFRGNSPAKNVTAILDAFQELGWPVAVDDPLPGGKNVGRLKQAVYTLNQKQQAIKFHANGSGDGIRWHFTSPN